MRSVAATLLNISHLPDLMYHLRLKMIYQMVSTALTDLHCCEGDPMHDALARIANMANIALDDWAICHFCLGIDNDERPCNDPTLLDVRLIYSWYYTKCICF